MNLREVCALEPGDLIMGVVYDVRKKREYLSKEGWFLSEGKSQPFVPLSNPNSTGNERTPEDETVRCINIYYIPNNNVQDVIKNMSVIKSSKHYPPGHALPPFENQIDTTNLATNSKHMKNTIAEHLTYETVSQGNYIGMSLGETLVMIIPSDFQNRSNYAAICCLHKTLFLNKIVWVCLHVNISTNYYEKFFSNLPDAKMEI